MINLLNIICVKLVTYKALPCLAALNCLLVRTGSVSNNGSLTTVAGHFVPKSSTSTRDPNSVSSSGRYANDILF